MKNFLVIGLGSFGLTLARALIEQGNEVAVVDLQEERVNEARNFVDKAIIADVKRRDVLAELHVDAFDTVVVNLGDEIDASILTTLFLKQMGARRVFVKATSEDHATILKMVGADQVIFPERDTALRLSHILGSPNLLDEVLLAPGYSLIEMSAPDAFVGRSLAKLNLTNLYRVQVLLIKRPGGAVVFPRGELEIHAGDTVVLMGRDPDLKVVEAL